MIASVLAHQGGWDEILLVLVPLGLLAGLLALARRRVGQLERDAASGPDTGDATDDVAPGDPGRGGPAAGD